VLPSIFLSNTALDELTALNFRQDTAFPMSTISKASNQWPVHNDKPNSDDLFIQADGFAYAGRHLLFDCWNASNLDNLELIEKALLDAVLATRSTLLHIHLHHFPQNGGVSGVAVLAESHISIHTWPERDYAALDVFMCGGTSPELALPIFRTAFSTENIEVSEHMRGRQFTDMTPQSNIKKDIFAEA